MWVLLAAGGVTLLTATAGSSGGGMAVAGVGFALFAGACWAAYILLAQRVGRNMPGGAGVADRRPPVPPDPEPPF